MIVLIQNMSQELMIEGRRTGIINPNTNLGITLSASYQDKKYDLFRVTITVKVGSDIEDRFALSCPSTTNQSELVSTLLSNQPKAGLLFHFRPEDRRYVTAPGLNGVILMAEAGKDKYSAFLISGYERKTHKPQVIEMILERDKIKISDSAKEAIDSVPIQLR